RRPEARVLGRRAHRELVHVRFAEERQPRLLAAGSDGGVEDWLVAGEDPRGGGRLDPTGGDQVFEGDWDAVPLDLVDRRQERVQLGVALVDRRSVGAVQLSGGNL